MPALIFAGNINIKKIISAIAVAYLQDGFSKAAAANISSTPLSQMHAVLKEMYKGSINANPNADNSTDYGLRMSVDGVCGSQMLCVSMALRQLSRLISIKSWPARNSLLIRFSLYNAI